MSVHRCCVVISSSKLNQAVVIINSMAGVATHIITHTTIAITRSIPTVSDIEDQKKNGEKRLSIKLFSKVFHLLDSETKTFKTMRAILSVLIFLSTYICNIEVESRTLRSKYSDVSLAEAHQETDSAPVRIFFNAPHGVHLLCTCVQTENACRKKLNTHTHIRTVNTARGEEVPFK